jgi:4-hydroxy-3-methylbut-2-enyl diphosphate reductase
MVTKIHREARRFAQDGYTVILIGEPGHDEVVGTRGEAPEQVIVVTGPGDIDRIEVRDPERVAWISQSTLVVEFVADMVSRLRERFPALADPPREDICYAVSNRQAAGRLVPAALAAGAREARRVDSAAELRAEWLDGVRTIGVTSGASTPDFLVRGVLAWLAEWGYPVGEEVVSKVETQVFAPPRALVSAR